MPRTWTLPAAIYDAMAAQAERDWPEETCGLIFGADERTLELVPMANRQNEMHRRDPANFPRDARTAYFLDPQAFLKLLDAKEKAGVPMRAIYHSHPEHAAYFSKKDREDAAPPGLGPLYPDCVYLVFSVLERRVAEVKGFEWSESAGDFVEVLIARGAWAPG